MKKALSILLLVILLFCVVSCSKLQNVCWYGYFSDTACMVVYSADKNTVYDIQLPLKTIIAWGLQNGIENIPNAIRSFIGMNEVSFMYGSPETFKGLCAINKALENNKASLNDPVLLANINKLCSADFSVLAKIFSEAGPDVFEIDGADFTDGMDLEAGRLYYSNWIKQVVGE